VDKTFFTKSAENLRVKHLEEGVLKWGPEESALLVSPSAHH